MDPAAHPPTEPAVYLSPGDVPTAPRHRTPAVARAGVFLCRDAAAATAARRYLAGVLDDWRLPAALADAAALVAAELVANAVRHGDPCAGPVRLLLALDGRTLTVTVADRTPYRPLPPAALPAWDEDDPATWQESGRGLGLVEALSEVWGHRPVGGDPARGTAVWAALTGAGR